jgi:multidrug efflux pump subunit AcrA (membrane-fusion protein)
VVHDPVSGAYFQLGADELAIAQAFDGTRDPAAVAALQVAAGVPVAVAEVEAFARTLWDAGILLSAGAVGERPAPPPRRRAWHERLLQIEIAAWRPQRFFASTVTWVRPLLRPPALAGGAVLVLAAFWITAGNGGELRSALGGAFAAVSWVAIWFIYGAVVLVHELAHGYTCAAFGGRVQTLGFLLLYGKPCAYCDVTDAWMLGKRARLWVMAAGSLVELGMWAAATVVWRVTAPETWVHRGALVVLAVCGIGTLFNFNPLLKFDGYYMLADGVEVPNLRQRAFADLWARILRREPPPATARERRIFLAYGILAVVYSAVVLGILFERAHAWIGSRWGGTGLVILWGGVVAVSARPARRALADVREAWRRGGRGRRLMVAAIGVVVVALLGLVRWPMRVAAECRIEPRERIVVRSPVEGSLQTIAAREGAWVEAGDTLAQLTTRDVDFALARARAQVASLDAQLTLLVRGARPQEIAMARQRVAGAAARVDFAQRAAERARRSLASDVTSRADVETAENLLEAATSDAAAARQALDLLESGAQPEELQSMRAQLDAARAQAAQLEDERQRTVVTAPQAGHVLTPYVERQVGRFVERGDSLLVLADLRTMVVEIPVSEKDVADVAPGLPVHFKARSLPARLFEARVVEVAPAAAAAAREQTVLVRSEVDNRDGALRPGTTGFAKIQCGRRPLGRVLSRRLVRMLRTEFWALW